MNYDERAMQKLRCIIEREGDSDGERLKPYYLEMLKDEIMQADNLPQTKCDIPMPKCKPPKQPRAYEGDEQRKLFEWVGYMGGKYPDIEMMYHIPNGGSRNKIEAANLKRQGVKAGVPDLCLPVARGKYHGLYIEMKAGKNKTSEKQDEWIAKLHNQGYAAIVCYGCGQAIEVITKYLGLGRPRTEIEVEEIE